MTSAEMRAGFREAADRWVNFWHRYSGSVAFASVLIVCIVGFWHANAAIDRLEDAEQFIHAEREARIQALLFERDERVAAQLAQAAALARYEADVAKRLAEEHIRVLRAANIEGCQRENQLRRRQRASVSAQIVLTQGMGAAAVSRLSLSEYVAVMNRQEQALVQLLNELEQVDCEKAYPAP